MFRLTHTKRRTLELLSEYFCLRVKDAARLLRNREPTETDLRNFRRTLALLCKEQLATRLPYFDLSTEGVSYVYGLTARGVREYGGKRFDEHSARTLEHELEITFFHMRLQQFATQRSLKLRWYQADLKRGAVHPDALFALTDPSKSAGRNTHYFFLEIERAKIGNYRGGEPSISRKIAKYYQLFDTAGCETVWGFRHFRVIVVLPTEERCGKLRKALQDEYRHQMFWLTAESLYKRDIGARIFVTPQDQEAPSYGFGALW